MNSLTLQARWVLPLDQPPLQGGLVTYRDGKIIAVRARRSSVPGIDPGKICDLGDVVLLPGLVNAHTHLEFSQLEQPLGTPGLPLPAWIRLVLGDRKRAHHDPAQAISLGLAESLRQGTTTLGEIATSSATFYDQQSPAPGLTLFDEVIGFSAARIDSVLGASHSRWLSNHDSLTDSQHSASVNGCSLGLSPHAPYTVHPQLLTQLVTMAQKHHIPVAMHLAESAEELELLALGRGPFQQLLEERSMWDSSTLTRGSKPIDYLQQLALAPRSLVVHGNYLEPNDFEFLAQYGQRMSVVYCPRTHAYFEHLPYPLAAMLAAGVPVALGTDSRASNPDLSLLSELREVARQHPGLRPATIVELGTLAGARALGQDHQVGSITPGKWANLTAIPCAQHETDPWTAVITGDAQPTTTWLAGQLCYEQGDWH